MSVQGPEPFVYVVAFSGQQFVMVRHRLRAWEMPGGRMKPEESPEETASREFCEETGMMLEAIGGIDIPGGRVVVGLAHTRCTGFTPTEEIAEVRLFSELPAELSFPEVEYREMLDRASRMVETFKRGKNISASASPQAKQFRSE